MQITPEIQKNITTINRLRTPRSQDLSDRLLAPSKGGAVVAGEKATALINQFFGMLFHLEPSLCVIEIKMKFPHNDDICSAKRNGDPLVSKVGAEEITPERAKKTRKAAQRK